MSKFRGALLPIVPLATFMVTSALGETDSPEQRLEKAKRLDCTFSAVATATWDEGIPSAAETPATLEASFFDIDIAGGTAEAGGRFGASFIAVRYAHGYLHLIQTYDAGPLYVTTIFARETAPGRFAAVHVRHEYTQTRLPGFTSRPELYAGDCAIAD